MSDNPSSGLESLIKPLVDAKVFSHEFLFSEEELGWFASIFHYERKNQDDSHVIPDEVVDDDEQLSRLHSYMTETDERPDLMQDLRDLRNLKAYLGLSLDERVDLYSLFKNDEALFRGDASEKKIPALFKSSISDETVKAFRLIVINNQVSRFLRGYVRNVADKGRKVSLTNYSQCFDSESGIRRGKSIGSQQNLYQFWINHKQETGFPDSFELWILQHASQDLRDWHWNNFPYMCPLDIQVKGFVEGYQKHVVDQSEKVSLTSYSQHYDAVGGVRLGKGKGSHNNLYQYWVKHRIDLGLPDSFAGWLVSFFDDKGLAEKVLEHSAKFEKKKALDSESIAGDSKQLLESYERNVVDAGKSVSLAIYAQCFDSVSGGRIDYSKGSHNNLYSYWVRNRKKLGFPDSFAGWLVSFSEDKDLAEKVLGHSDKYGCHRKNKRLVVDDLDSEAKRFLEAYESHVVDSAEEVSLVTFAQCFDSVSGVRLGRNNGSQQNLYNYWRRHLKADGLPGSFGAWIVSFLDDNSLAEKVLAYSAQYELGMPKKPLVGDNTLVVDTLDVKVGKFLDSYVKHVVDKGEKVNMYFYSQRFDSGSGVKLDNSRGSHANLYEYWVRNRRKLGFPDSFAEWAVSFFDDKGLAARVLSYSSQYDKMRKKRLVVDDLGVEIPRLLDSYVKHVVDNGESVTLNVYSSDFDSDSGVRLGHSKGSQKSLYEYWTNNRINKGFPGSFSEWAVSFLDDKGLADKILEYSGRFEKRESLDPDALDVEARRFLDSYFRHIVCPCKRATLMSYASCFDPDTGVRLGPSQGSDRRLYGYWKRHGDDEIVQDSFEKWIISFLDDKDLADKILEHSANFKHKRLVVDDLGVEIPMLLEGYRKHIIEAGEKVSLTSYVLAFDPVEGVCLGKGFGSQKNVYSYWYRKREELGLPDFFSEWLASFSEDKDLADKVVKYSAQYERRSRR